MRLRFTIRDLLWLTLVVALCFGWWFNYRQMESQITQLQNAAPTVSISDERVEKAMQIDGHDF
jgi:hypothetical protein